MIGTFKYAANPSMVLGIRDQQTGAEAILLPANTSLDRILWNVNNRSGHITLVESGNTLALTTSSISTGAAIVLREKNDNELAQKWDMTSKSGFILSQANNSFVIDDSNRGQSANTRIQLYPFNGSPAQQWIFVPMSMMKAVMSEEKSF